jgi:hypothetical protein
MTLESTIPAALTLALISAGCALSLKNPNVAISNVIPGAIRTRS